EPVPQPSPPSKGPAPAAIVVEAMFASDGPLARSLAGYEDRAQQRALAGAIERAFADGGALIAEAGTGVGKSVAYLVPSLGRALAGERVVVSTHTLPLQDQLVRKDLRALQSALGTNVSVTVLKGRSNYLCPRRWQQFRGLAATREEARLALKTLVWRQTTVTGDRAELNLLGAESDLWPRISADDETCDGRRCARVAGGCYLPRDRATEIFGALANVIDPRAQEDRLRITPGLRASDERWLPVELAGERLADAVAGIAAAAERLATRTADEDEQAELRSAASELSG